MSLTRRIARRLTLRLAHEGVKRPPACMLTHETGRGCGMRVSGRNNGVGVWLSACAGAMIASAAFASAALAQAPSFRSVPAGQGGQGAAGAFARVAPPPGVRIAGVTVAGSPASTLSATAARPIALMDTLPLRSAGGGRGPSPASPARSSRISGSKAPAALRSLHLSARSLPVQAALVPTPWSSSR
jgi:hypothetical protein